MMAVEWISHPPVVITSWAEVLAFLTLLTVLGTVVSVARRYWKVTQCHIAGCKRHQWKRVPGTDHVVCKSHLKKITGRGEPSHAQVLEDHQAARTAAARSL